MKSLALAVTLLLAPFAQASLITVNSPVEANLTIGNGAFRLQFDSTVGKYYQVQISTDMVSWDNEGWSIKGTGGRVETVVNGRGLAKAFYRLRDDGDPKNIGPVAVLVARTWHAVLPQRAAKTVYQNSNPFEIQAFIAFGPSDSPDDGANYVYLYARPSSAVDWMEIGSGFASDRFGQQQGQINSTIPSGWEYKIDSSSRFSNILLWQELW